ncbi:MAG TPA: hypothetical protein VFI95_10855 [Terriglobales bacterium]|nr:hypothetical protein [Terriglobales bacterium]
MSNNGDGSWSETVLHAFIGRDGSAPIGPLAFDKSRNLYAAESGGADSRQNFQPGPPSNGSWGLHVLHNFTGGSDGASPLAGVTLNSFGIFGTASARGSGGSGVAFRIKP